MEIGYACKLVGVPETSISGCTLKNCSRERLLSLIEKNLECLDRMIDYNIKMGIKLFRISSDIIPFGSHPMNDLPWEQLFEKALKAIGDKIRSSGIRVSMHPGQYTVLNSLRKDVVEKSKVELLYHCTFLDALGVGSESKIIIHLGGVYGDKTAAKARFIKAYQSLPVKVKARLVIENDDRSFTIEDIFEIGRKENIPVVFDNLHHKLNQPDGKGTDIEWITAAKATWEKIDGPQKIHYSQQKIPGSLGAHSDTILLEEFQSYYWMLRNAGLDVDIMLEVKDKNLSAVKCKNGIEQGMKIRALEEEWARYKYFVLGKSASLYNEIRQLLKEKTVPDRLGFYRRIEQAMEMTDVTGSQINAVQHIWGYVNNNATQIETNRYQKLLTDYYKTGKSLDSIKKHLYKMAVRQNQEFLINSLYFYL